MPNPECGAGRNAEIDQLEAAVDVIEMKINQLIGRKPEDIMDVVCGNDGRTFKIVLTERQLKIIRFCLNCTLETA